MKKVISICLILVMALAVFAGCSNNPEKEKEELLSQAVEVEANDISNDSFDNLVKAKEKYCNKVLKLKGTVNDIAEDHIVLGYLSTIYSTSVYLPTEEIAKLEAGQLIVVVGETTDEVVEKTETAFGSDWEYYYYQMPTAYLVQDRFEYTGILDGENASYAPAYNIFSNDEDRIAELIYFADDVDTSSLQDGQKIKYEAKRIYTNSSWQYKDAKITETSE